MKLANKTNTEVYYSIGYTGTGDCGNIAAQTTTDLPFYDNRSGVTVSMAPVGGKSFSLEVPESGEGNTVTIAMFFS